MKQDKKQIKSKMPMKRIVNTFHKSKGKIAAANSEKFWNEATGGRV